MRIERNLKIIISCDQLRKKHYTLHYNCLQDFEQNHFDFIGFCSLFKPNSDFIFFQL